MPTTDATLRQPVAGTPVWTVDGARPVEKLEVGDLVLSQDGDTGELAYKPVLRTTTATPAQLVKVRTGGEAFDCTGGHRFWVCGEGWVRARRLRAPAMLHGAAGSVSVGVVESGPTLRTYNLVVGDFNTYFVGREKLLVHDVTASRPTATSVPGLKRP